MIPVFAVLCLFILGCTASQVSFIHETTVDAELVATARATFDLTDQRLVHVLGEDQPRYMTEADKLDLSQIPRGFLDITEHPDFTTRVAQPRPFVKRNEFTFTNGCNPFVQSISENLETVIQNMDRDLSKLTSFWTRSYRSMWGQASSDWLYNHLDTLVRSLAPPGLRFTISKIPHDFPQYSIRVRLESANSIGLDSKRDIIILGAHQDSLNYKYPFHRAPGADDDGSGTVVTIQILRTLLETGFVIPDGVAIEFHWYAGEEGGVLGSIDIASAYQQDNVPVKAMLQMDCLALTPADQAPVIALFTTPVNQDLNDFGISLIEKYNTIPWIYTECGVLCVSDHVPWNYSGYPAMFVAEGDYQTVMRPAPYHTTGDVIGQAGWNSTHMAEFVKFGLAFVTELAAPSLEW